MEVRCGGRGWRLYLSSSSHAGAGGGRPLVATTLALVLLALLVQVHASAPARRSARALGLALWQLLGWRGKTGEMVAGAGRGLALQHSPTAAVARGTRQDPALSTAETLEPPQLH